MTDQLTTSETRELANEAEITVKDTVAEKWGKAVGPGSGWVAVPLSLLRLQQKYELNPTEMMVLINLLAHWWSPQSTVFPRNSIIAKRMNVDPRTVQRATKKLRDKGLMRSIELPTGKRAFVFEPLVKRLSKDMHEAFNMSVYERL
ncbi:MAG: helix-turn-helix domain-containing protein [Qipengyuania sp.]